MVSSSSSSKRRSLKWCYLASLILPFVLSMIAVRNRDAAPAVGALVILVMLSGIITFCMWTHETWTALPKRERGDTSSGVAVAYCFVPFLNLWWMFEMHRRIADALTRILAGQQSFTRAPTILARVVPGATGAVFALVAMSVASKIGAVAPTAQAPSALFMFLPFVYLIPFLHFAWMLRVDRCFEEIEHRRTILRNRKRERENDE